MSKVEARLKQRAHAKAHVLHPAGVSLCVVALHDVREERPVASSANAGLELQRLHGQKFVEGHVHVVYDFRLLMHANRTGTHSTCDRGALQQLEGHLHANGGNLHVMPFTEVL